jgi:streptomycin 6-kinase
VFDVPPSLAWLQAEPAGRDWLEALPRLVSGCVERWSLQLGELYAGSHVSFVAPAVLPDGTDAVLKVQWPHRECLSEADALVRWDGDGAVRLIDHDPDSSVLLIERCIPGDYLSTVDGASAVDVLVGLLPRLWKPAGAPFTPLADEARHWADGLRTTWQRAGEPVPRWLVDTAVNCLRELVADQAGQEQVLLHQDLHGDNVVSAEREPWLVIDPKPLAGERAFGIAPIVRSAELGHGPDQVRYRFDRLTAELGLDRERARGWAVGQAVAWGIDEDGVFASHIEAAQWLLDRG